MEATVLSLGKFVLDETLNYAKSALAEKVALQLGVRSDQAFITDELETMQAFLMVAHEEQQDQHRVLKPWVKQVREVAYDVEDCLQDFSVHLQVKRSWWRFPRTLLERHRIAREMKDLRARVEDVSERNLRYHLIKGSSSKPATAAEKSIISAAAMFDIDKEAWRTRKDQEETQKVDLVQLVTKGSNDLGVIAVWGRSGDLGNTYIIRAAYDNDTVKGKFGCCAWLRLMHPFNPIEFLQSLLRQFYETEELEEKQGETTVGLEILKRMEAAQGKLVDEVNRYVTTKSYLVVLTDLSTVEDWYWIKTYFPDKKNGSRIILSTLQIDVPRLCLDRPYRVSEVLQCSFNEAFYVFYKEDSLHEKENNPDSSSSSTTNSIVINNSMEPSQIQPVCRNPIPTPAKALETIMEEDDKLEPASCSTTNDTDHSVMSSQIQLVNGNPTPVSSKASEVAKEKDESSSRSTVNNISVDESVISIGEIQTVDGNPTPAFGKALEATMEKDDNPESSSRSAINNIAANNSVVSNGEIQPVDGNPTPSAAKEVEVEDAVEKEQLIIERKEAISKLIQLISEGDSSKNIFEVGQVISIWGMGGIGKTTFAKSVYERYQGLDGSVKFERRAWLTTSTQLSDTELHRHLVRQLDQDDGEDKVKAPNKQQNRTQSNKQMRRGQSIIAKMHTSFLEASGLQGGARNTTDEVEIDKLAKVIKEKKCLIIIDDLPSIAEWDRIKNVIKITDGNSANRIIVTTREFKVAKHCSSGEQYTYRLERLNDDCALRLFKTKVFKDIKERENFDDNLDLIGQAKFILKKCDGYPLAISTIGSFLATRPKTIMEWRNLNKHISAELDINPELGIIKATLTSSYDGLPYHLKSCFLYLSIFPEDHHIRSTRLVRRWIAEGYLTGIHSKTGEEVGKSYITELINRSLIQTLKESSLISGRFGVLQVHDLIREIGISKSREENLVFTLEEGCSLNTQGTIRHLAVSRNWKRDKTAFRSALDVSHLRSLTVFGEWKSYFISDKMRLLRVLDFEDTKGLRNDHLHPVGELLHLRYLSLRGCSDISVLPSSVGNLRCLQTLDIRETRIIRLPATIIKLHKLQYLHANSFVPRDKDRNHVSRDSQKEHKAKDEDIYGTVDSREKNSDDDYWHSREYEKKTNEMRGMFCICCCCCCCCPLCPIIAGIRWSWRLGKYGVDGVCMKYLGLVPCGVKVPEGIQKMKALHTLGAINVAGRKGTLKELKELTQLRKLKVTGINKKNCRHLFSAIEQHEYLESLSVWSKQKEGLHGCLDDKAPTPPGNLQSLELYGSLGMLPKWIKGLRNLVKLLLRSSRISDYGAALQVLGQLPNLTVLRLWQKSFQGETPLHFEFQKEAFTSLTVLDLDLLDNLESVKFEAGAMLNLELLEFRCWASQGKARLFSGLSSLPRFKEFSLDNDDKYEVEFVEDVWAQLAENKNAPILKRY